MTKKPTGKSRAPLVETGREGLKRKLYAPREIIFEQGSKADGAYLIVEGDVEIFRVRKKGEAGVGLLSRGDIFGEMSLIDGKPRGASARAVGEVELIMIRPGDLEQRLSTLADLDGVLRRLIDVFVQRLRGQLDRID